MGYPDRVLRLQNMMREKNVDLLLLTDPGAMAYVSGVFSLAWHGGDAIVVPSRGDVHRVLSIAERGRHEIDGWIKNLTFWNPPFADLPAIPFTQVLTRTIVDLLPAKSTIGIQEETIPWRWLEGVRKEIREATFTDVGAAVKCVMMRKDDEEVEWMRAVAQIAEAGFRAAYGEIRPGEKETEVAACADAALFRAGSSYVYTPTLVISDPKVVWDHPPVPREIKKGDIVKVDVHPVYKEYRADYYNIFSVGKPTDGFKKMCDAVAEAVRDMMAAMKPGAVSKDLDAIFRKKMAQRGFSGLSNVYLGHGIGTTHLPPFISREDETVLEKNMTIILNPFCYKPMEEGIFMEYMVLVTDSGIEMLNKGPLKLIELDF